MIPVGVDDWGVSGIIQGGGNVPHLRDHIVELRVGAVEHDVDVGAGIAHGEGGPAAAEGGRILVTEGAGDRVLLGHADLLHSVIAGLQFLVVARGQGEIRQIF